MSEACNKCEEAAKYIQSVGWETVKQRPLGRMRHRCEDNNKMNLKETGCEDVEWICQAQNTVQCQALVNMVMNLWVP